MVFHVGRCRHKGSRGKGLGGRVPYSSIKVEKMAIGSIVAYHRITPNSIQAFNSDIEEYVKVEHE